MDQSEREIVFEVKSPTGGGVSVVRVSDIKDDVLRKKLIAIIPAIKEESERQQKKL